MSATSRTRFPFLVTSVLVVGAGFACNAIVGVEDVRLKEDGGSIDRPDTSSSGGPVDEDVFVPPQETGSPLQHDNALGVAAGDGFTCARKPDFSVKCWGDDTYAQTGTGGAADGGIVIGPTAVSGAIDAVELGAGNRHACIVRQSGAIACWGYNLDGQLGDGTSNGRSAKPVAVKDITSAFSVAAGGNFTCALEQAGTVKCWGGNGSGQLGIGSATTKTTPQPVNGLADVRALAAGDAHACALGGDGKVKCWGDGTIGQLGTGMATSSQMPVPVVNVTNAIAIAAGAKTTYALTQDGKVLAWGANDVGQLGNGTTNTIANATPVTTKVVMAKAIAAGTSHACAALAAGGVQCWGIGAEGELGDGKTRVAGAFESSPVSVSGVQTAKGIAAGNQHSCTSTTAGAILCWGANARGQLGQKTTGVPEVSPVGVTGYP